MKKIFKIGMPEKETKFGKVFCEHVLSTFYPKFKQMNSRSGKLTEQTEARIRAAFDVIRQKTESDFVTGSLL